MNIEDLEKSASKIHRLVLGKDKDGTEFGVMVAGPESEQFREAEIAIDSYGIKAAAERGGVVLDPKRDEDARVIAERSQENRIIMATTCTVDWFGFKSNGTEAPFDSKTLARMLIKKPQWVRMINNSIDKEENFAEG